jgi:uncharacterized protein (DUF4415 family)
MPRPNIGRRITTVRLDPDVLALLDAEGGGEGSRGEMIRTILRRHYRAKGLLK